MENKKKFRLSLSKTILLGLVLGVLCGIFFGEHCKGLAVIGHAFIKLLQMTILPYIVLSLIVGIGSLSYDTAKLLAGKAGLLLMLFWGIGLAVIFAMPLSFPPMESASFFSSSLVKPQTGINFLDLFIPSNPFRSMADNIIPAVVLFCIAVGVALIGIKDKESLLHNLSTLSKALTRVAHFMVKLAPIGVFAIAASAAGTITPEEIGRLNVYFATFILTALLLTFWVLPVLVTTVTPLKYRDILSVSKDALVTAFTMDNLFIVLPILIQNCKDLLKKYKLDRENSESFIDIIIPVFFNFPHLGRMLSLLFVLFAAWFYGNPLDVADYPSLVFLGLPSLFSKPFLALPFLLDSMRLPSDIFELYEISAVINGRFMTLVAAMHLLAFTLITTCAISRSLLIKPKKLLIYIVVTVGLLVVVTTGTRAFFSRAVTEEYTKDQVVAQMQLLQDPVEATVHETIPSGPREFEPGLSRVEEIKKRGVVRVGYVADRLPFSYFNQHGELVGFDVEMAHTLAKELGVHLEFIPFQFNTLAQQLRENHFDIAMSGVPMVTTFLKEMNFSDDYMDITFSFVVKDHRRKEFATVEKIQRMERFRVALPGASTYFADRIKEVVPHAEVVSLNSIREFFESGGEGMDALIIGAEVGAAWTLLYPDFQVVIPEEVYVAFPLGYPIASGQQEWINLLNRWIDLKRKDRTIEWAYDYWILGKGATEKRQRWSIIRDVLHWVE